MAKAPLVIQPWTSVDADEYDIGAFKALAVGKASEGQQKLVLDFIINRIARTYDMSFRPGEDGPRATDFAEGKRYVGNQIIRLIKIDVKAKQKGAE